jgi:hypothetical protein
MTRTVLAWVVVVVASAVILSARQLPNRTTPLPDAPGDIQTLVRQAIEDRMAAQNIPDLDFRRPSPTLLIRREMPRAKMMLGPDAVPQVSGYTFLLRTNTELQLEAEQTHTSTMFIIVNSAGITGNTALVDLGTDVVFPSVPKVSKQCCCVGNGRFNRVGSRWVFERWVDMVCS